MTLADETEIVHSHLFEKDGQRKIIVNFERSYISMLRMEKFRLPKLFMVSGYTVYVWSNENGELFVFYSV